MMYWDRNNGYGQKIKLKMQNLKLFLLEVVFKLFEMIDEALKIGLKKVDKNYFN